MRLLLISFGALLTLIVGLVMARFWGLGQVYQGFDHAFLKPPTPWYAVQVRDLESAQKAQATDPQVIFWLDLYKSRDGQFLVSQQAPESVLLPELLKDKFRGPKTHFYDLEFLRLYFNDPLLEDFVRAFPQQRFILNLKDNAADLHTQFIQKIVELKIADQVLIQSDVEVTLTSIKEEHPMWLYGTHRSDLMRILSFESIKVEPASPFFGDVFISPLKISGRTAFNSTVLDEIRRRQKKILLGPLTSAEDVKQAKDWQPDGYIFESNDLFTQELDQHPAR